MIKRQVTAPAETRQHSGAQYPTVSIVVGGRFAAFDEARILERRGLLGGIVSAYPRAHREGISRAHLRWNPVLGLRSALEHRIRTDLTGAIAYRYATEFGRWAARRVPRADVVQAWTGYALEPLVAAKKMGALAVAFRGSAHIVAQARLLETEYAEFGFKSPAVYRPMIERECEEYETADAVNVISSFAHRTFIEEGYPESKLILTPLGVDIGEVAATPRTKVPRGPLRVLFLGAVSLQKGVHYLLQAAHSFSPPALKVSLVGGATPDGREVLRRFAHDGEWLGKVPRSELQAVLANHDCLVLPSVQDGFGAVIVEAMAAGLPVIATANTGAPDVIRDGVEGFIVPARSVEALRDALEVFVDDRERCVEMGRAAAAAISERRTWDIFVEEMLTAYREHRGRGAAARGG